MSIESLVAEVRTIANRFSAIDALRRAAEDGEPVAWYSARGMLDFAIACARISEISARIAKAGYRECDKDVLAEIGAESREILYCISNMRRPADGCQP
jgi:hypothetical protein